MMEATANALRTCHLAICGHFGHLKRYHGPGNQSSSHCVAQNLSYKGFRSIIQCINKISEDDQDDLKRTV